MLFRSLVDTVDLTFELDEAATKVTARLAVRRNPASADRAAPLRLDGEQLDLTRLVCNDERLSANQYHLDDRALTIPDAPDVCTLTIETIVRACLICSTDTSDRPMCLIFPWACKSFRVPS